MKLFVEVYRLCLGVLTHWDTPALWWCASTETEKNETEYLRLKTEPNQTKFEKSKPTQPYTFDCQLGSYYYGPVPLGSPIIVIVCTLSSVCPMPSQVHTVDHSANKWWFTVVSCDWMIILICLCVCWQSSIQHLSE